MLDSKYHKFLIDLAVKAGEESMRYFRTDFDVNFKSDNSPVTLADLEVNKIILEGLAETGIPVISEESVNMTYEQRKNLKEFWIIDPIDGTKQFVKGEDEFTVNIALVRNNKTVEGVVYAPAKSLLYYGSQKTGAERLNFKTGELKILKCEKLSEYKLNVVASKSHLNALTIDFLNSVKDFFGDFNTVNAGSSLKFCAVAEDSANLYPRLGSINEWDIAAGHAVLKAAGGNVLSLETGAELVYNSETLNTPDYIAVQNNFYLADLVKIYKDLKK